MQVSVRDVEDEATRGRCSSPWVLGCGLGAGSPLLSARGWAVRWCRLRRPPTVEDHLRDKRNAVGGGAVATFAGDGAKRQARLRRRARAHCYPPNPPVDPLGLGLRGPVRRGGCDVAEGAVTDYIEDPGGQAGSEVGSSSTPSQRRGLLSTWPTCLRTAEGASNSHSGVR
jgi:hypothetical protein